LNPALAKAVEGSTWEKFTNPTTGRRKTAFPKSPADQERFGVRWDLGVRWDYDRGVTDADIVYHKFQMQANSGRVPSAIKSWRESHGGTHGLMATALVEKDGTKEFYAH
jgi:hypothetical protein